MLTAKTSSHIRKVPANLDREVRVYLKVKNKLGMREWWCEIKIKLGEKMCIYLETTNKTYFIGFKYFQFSTWNAHYQQFDSK